MIRIFLFYGLILLVVAAAFVRGDRDTRAAALACLGASLLTWIVVAGMRPVEVGIMLVDLAVLAFFTAIALRSERFWPLWVAGLQLTTVLGHLLRFMRPDLLDVAYAAALRFWSYPILLIIIAAAWRSNRYRPPAPTLA